MELKFINRSLFRWQLSKMISDLLFSNSWGFGYNAIANFSSNITPIALNHLNKDQPVASFNKSYQYFARQMLIWCSTGMLRKCCYYYFCFRTIVDGFSISFCWITLLFQPNIPPFKTTKCYHQWQAIRKFIKWVNL